jgi:hypothetical protein
MNVVFIWITSPSFRCFSLYHVPSSNYISFPGRAQILSPPNAWVNRATAKPPASWARPAEQPAPSQAQNGRSGGVGCNLPCPAWHSPTGEHTRPLKEYFAPISGYVLRTLCWAGRHTAVTRTTSLTNANTSLRPRSDRPRLAPAQRRASVAAPTNSSKQPESTLSAACGAGDHSL